MEVEFSGIPSDITFKSCDGVLFKLHKRKVDANSGVLSTEGMQTSVDEVIPLVESSDTLEVVLKYLYPERRSKLADGMEFKLLDSVAEAAEKYQVWAAMDVCLDRMKNTLPQHADSILVYAKKHGYTELMDLAAIPLLDQNCEQVLRFLPDDLKVSWAIYYYKWSVVQLQACTAHNKWYGECTKQECRDILSRMAEAVSAVTSPKILEEIPCHWEGNKTWLWKHCIRDLTKDIGKFSDFVKA